MQNSGQYPVEEEIGPGLGSEVQDIEPMTDKRSILKRLDSLPLSRWHVFMVLTLGAVWIFDGYEVSLISLFRKYIVEENSDEVFKSLATAYQIGCIIGSIIFGISAFIIGRKKVFMITLSIYAVGIIFSLIDGSVPLFILGRFLTGISVGGQFTAIFTAIDEFLPPKYRGRVNIGIDGTWHLGGAMAASLNLVLGEIPLWRYLFAIGFVGVFSLLVLRRNIPESPRWLVLKNETRTAEEIIGRIQAAVANRNIFLEQDSQLHPHFQNHQHSHPLQQKIDLNPDSARSNPNQESVVSSHLSGSSIQSSPSSRLEHKTNQHKISRYAQQIFQLILGTFLRYKSRFFLAVFLMFTQAFFFNLVYYKFPATLEEKYHLSQSDISLYMLPLSLCSFLSTLVVGPFFDLIGRRQLLLVTCTHFSFNSDFLDGQLIIPFSIDCSSGVLLFVTSFIEELIWLEVLTCFMFCFTSPAGSSANLIASEIFPTSSRTLILFLMFNVGMLGGIGGVWLNAIWIGSLLMVAAGVLGFVICPKSENRSLEDIENLQQ